MILEEKQVEDIVVTSPNNEPIEIEITCSGGEYIYTMSNFDHSIDYFSIQALYGSNPNFRIIAETIIITFNIATQIPPGFYLFLRPNQNQNLQSHFNKHIPKTCKT